MGLLLILSVAFFVARNRMDDLAHLAATSWGRSFFYINPWWKFQIEGQNHLDSIDEPVVFVANHQSAADIVAVYLLGVQFRWLSKASMFKWPMIGLAMRIAGYVPVERGNKESHIRAYNQSRETLLNGKSMLYFPEGGRSKNGQIKTFKHGAFRLALETTSPILPIVISGTKNLMPRRSFVPGVASMKMKVLPAYHPKNGDDVASITAKIREVFLNELKET